MRKFKDIEQEYFEKNEKFNRPESSDYKTYRLIDPVSMTHEDSKTRPPLTKDKILHVIENKEEYNEHWVAYQKQQSAVLELWLKELREEFSHLSQKVFDVCYDKAYEDGHANGYDEVYHEMNDIVDFVEIILKAIEKQ